MKYIYSNLINYPCSWKTLQLLNKNASLLSTALNKVNLSALNISEYNHRYIKWKLKRIVKELSIYNYLLAIALQQQTDFRSMTIVDFGGGSGMLSFLAKQLGIGRVIYCDIYDVSCKDVLIMSSKLKIPIDDIVCGDITDLEIYLKTNNIHVDAMISHNLIEHVYDYVQFVQKMKRMASDNFIFVHATGVNEKNPVVRRYFRKLQKRYENRDRKNEWGLKKRDSLKSFYKIRYELIENHNGNLNKSDIKSLAKRTRGLAKKDIESCVDEYVVHGNISYSQKHPTNTCDPLTANRTEHFLDWEWFINILAKNDFSGKIIPGYHESDGIFFVRKLKNVINFFIGRLKINSFVLAPYIVFTGHLKKRI